MDKVKVRNISGRAMGLSCGILQAGEEGEVTVAEFSTLHKYFKQVEEKATDERRSVKKRTSLSKSQ